MPSPIELGWIWHFRELRHRKTVTNITDSLSTSHALVPIQTV